MKKDTGEVVAIKALPLDPDADDATFRTIAKEIQMLKDCNHPNIVSFYGSYVRENELWVSLNFRFFPEELCSLVVIFVATRL